MKPEVGQRWQTSDTTYDIVDRVYRYGVLVARPVEGFMLKYGDQWLSPSTFAGWRYLGPIPAPAPLPSSTVGAPAPVTYVGIDYGYPSPPADTQWWYATPCKKTLGPFEGGAESNAAGLHHEVACQACLEIRRPAALPTREQILAEEFRRTQRRIAEAMVSASFPRVWVEAPKPPKAKSTEEVAAELANIARVRAHQLAEGGDSAVAKAPGRTPPKPWVPSVDPDHWIPDAEPHSSRYRR